ncbi:MAG: TfoX/Sxy family protein [Dehalococcoidia bacterium]
MAYDEMLAQRVRALLAKKGGVTERKMFGGIAFMVGGNMCVGVVKDDLMVRVGPDGHDDALAQPGARPMDFTGRPMRGMVFVGPRGYRTGAGLSAWVQRGVAFAKTLPAK